MVHIFFGKPKQADIQNVVAESQRKGFNYEHQGETAELTNALALKQHGWQVLHNRTQVGQGQHVFERAKQLLRSWGHFQLGWAEVDKDTPVKEGTGLCVCAQTILWTANPLEIVYVKDNKSIMSCSGSVGAAVPAPARRFSFAHGCLHGHFLAGEERFAIELNEEDNSVWYDVLSFSRPQHPLAVVSYPLLLFLQHKFAADSMHAVATALSKQEQSSH